MPGVNARHRRAAQNRREARRRKASGRREGWNRVLDRLDVVVSIIANTTVVLALVIAWWSYRAQLDQGRRDAAFEIVSGLNGGEILAAQKRFNAAFQSLPLDHFRDTTVKRDTMATLVAQLVTASGPSEELREDIVALVSYFDEMAICVETGTCDAGVVHAHAGEAAGRYACILVPYTQMIRDQYLLDGLGDGLKRMSGYEDRC